MKKNTSGQVVGAQLVSATDGSAFTGTATVYVTGDGGTQAIGSVGSGLATHEGNGFHTYAPSPAETNYNHIGFTFIGTGAVPATVQVYTSFPQTGDAYAGLATANYETIADYVWDEVLTGATHNIVNSAGRRLREIAGGVVTTGTAQGGATASITLASGASSVDGTYDPSIVVITGGTGAGQARLITQYTGSTRVAAVDRDWRVTPDATSEYEIIASPNLISTNEGLAQGGSSTTITLNASASSTNDAYVGQTVVLRTGTGQDQSRIITAYNGTTKVATVSTAWQVNPAAGTGYLIWPLGRARVTSLESGAITSSAFGTGAITAAAVATATYEAVADYVWDEVLTGATHNITNSAGRRLRQVRSSLYTGTAQSGGNLTITLDTGASSTDDIYNGEIISIISGTGAGQTRSIVNYVGSSRLATVEREWIVNPDNTSVFEIVGADELLIIDEGIAQAGAASTITLASTASSTDDTYTGSSLVISGGTGRGQARLITDYVGSTRVATVAPAWTTQPDSTSIYQVLPVGQVIVESFNGNSLADINAEVVDALSVDTYAEPGQGAPAATASLAAKVGYLYKAFRNRTTQTSTLYQLYADDGTTVDQKAAVSDDGTTFERGEIATGP